MYISIIVRKMIKSLSPTEQMIYSKLYPKRVITTMDVFRILKDRHRSVDYLTNLREKGFVQKIRRGVYAILPPDAVGGSFLPDKFLVAGKLRDRYYISHHSALELHGVAESTFNTVYISSPTYQRSLTHQGVTYRIVTTKHFFGMEDIQYKGEQLLASDLEKTVLDCIKRIKYAGGLEELLKSLSNIPYVNYEKLWRYLKKFDEKVLYHKTGFLLETLKRTPVSFLNKIKGELGGTVYYLYGKKNCVYNRDWNLMIPENLDELVRFA